MSQFKLIAIIPLSGCDEEYSKNLKIGGKHLFYNNYSVELNKELTSVLSVTRKRDEVPKDLYLLDNGIKLNISAIVGENGSGKSTLFELLYYLIYIISTEKSINNDQLLYHKSEDLENYLSDLKKDYRIEQIKSLMDGEEISDSPELILFQLIKKYKLEYITESTLEGNNLRKQIITELERKKIEIDNWITKEKKLENDIKDKLAVSILFEKNKSIYEIEYSNRDLVFSKIEQEGKTELTRGFQDFCFEDFFYTVSINYSSHSLNSNTIGNWISKLFHKNDAYITPVVINPMRNEGNFDINKELHLSKERLMANVLYDIINKKDSLVLNKYEVKSFVFKLKKGKSSVFPIDYDDSYFEKDIIGKLLKAKIGITSSSELLPKQHGYALSYLDKKIDKIRDHYGFIIYNGESPPLKINEDDILLNFLRDDNSHITKKIRQTINFIKNTIKYPEFWDFEEGVAKFIDKDRLIEWIQKCSDEPTKLLPTELIELALPGFFNVDFEFVSPEKKNKIITLGNMSSGEQQMILNINSIMYHLYNLQSVHLLEEKDNVDRNEASNLDRVGYSNVNISLDEIELYYHPEMQRSLVNNLVNSLEKIKAKGEIGIKAINVCFVTHSPFILSDIPTQNILKIETNSQGELIINTENNQTFGANIHDLLANEFFLRNGFMGELAKNKIKSLIKYLTSDYRKSKGWEMSSARCFIELIGEPFLKNDLLELYRTKKDRLLTDEESIKIEIQRLSKKLKKK